MTISADTLRLLMEVGVTGEALLRVAEAIEAEVTRYGNGVTKDVTYNAAKQARYRARKAAKQVTNEVTNSVTPLPPRARVEGSSSSSETTGHKQDSSLRSQCAREGDTPEFMEFWNAYPNKVGKPAARLKWPKALEKAGLADILTGLQRYIRDKPADRQWLNPATFLHQERWADQPLYANGHDPPRKLRGSAALSELASRPFEEIFPNVRSFNRS